MRNRLTRNWKQLIKKKSFQIYVGIAVFVLLLNVLAWNSREFCDAYITYIFPMWLNTYGRITGLFPFSVGEWMIVAAVVLVVMAVVLLPVAVIKRKLGRFYVFFAWMVLGVCLIMTLNCTILYHASTFGEKYFEKEDADTSEYTLEDLLKVRNLVIQKCNEYSQIVEREPDGVVRYPGDTASVGSAMQEKAIESMQALGKTYPQLDGFYPRPKAMVFSDFMCQQYMQGYYFPFSLEANYNDVMHVMNKPSTMCHELAHLRGYIYEDEANFISFLACIQSDDVYFQYAGYLSVLNYLENDIYKEYQANPEYFWQVAERIGYVEVLPQVYEDNIFVEQEEWDRINGKAVLETETVEAVSDAFVDTSLKMNGVSDGMVSYSRVVELLLRYYNS